MTCTYLHKILQPWLHTIEGMNAAPDGGCRHEAYSEQPVGSDIYYVTCLDCGATRVYQRVEIQP